MNMPWSEEKAKVVKKTTTKFQANKLEEKDIDTSNIVVEKKKEEKPLKSWVVDADKVDTVFRKDFDMSKVDTEFTSLTDQDLNKELEKVPFLTPRKPKFRQRKTKTNLSKKLAESNSQSLKNLQLQR